MVLYRAFQKDGTGLTGGQGAGFGAISGLIGAFVDICVNQSELEEWGDPTGRPYVEGSASQASLNSPAAALSAA